MLSAYEALEQFRWTKEENDCYVRSSLAKDNIEAGYEDKFNEGIAHGMARGIADGKIAESINIAQNALKAGLSLETISGITALSIEEINKLR